MGKRHKFRSEQLIGKKGKGYRFDMDNDPCTVSYLEKARGFKTIDTEEEQRIIYRIKAGDPDSAKLTETLVKSHQAFIVMFAQRHCPIGSDVFMDLIQEGNYGMCVALDRFDPTRKVKFLSYANSWIVKYMYEFLQNNELVQRNNRSKTFGNDSKFREMFVKKYGREPSCEELMALFNEMGISLRNPMDLHDIQIVSMDRPNTPCGSSDSDDDEPARTQYGEDDDIVGRLDMQEKAAVLHRVMSEELTDEEAAVLGMKYGFGGTDELSNREIAKLMGTTPYRIRLVTESAVAKIAPYRRLFE